MPPVAKLGDTALCPADVHMVGPTPTPFPVTGPIVSGSAKVFVFGIPLARVEDKGVHAACIGSNQFEVSTGSTKVFDSNKAVARLGDQTAHCGDPGIGFIMTGAFTVLAD